MLVIVGVLWNELQYRVRALRSEPRRDLGASALEWAIIAAVSVVIAAVIGSVIYNVVSDRSSEVDKCGHVAAGAKC